MKTLHPDQHIPADTPIDSDIYSHLDGRIRLWEGRQTKAEELKQLHWPRWRSYWSYYRNKVKPITDPAQWWRSNEAIPTPFKIVETILPRYLLSMFEDPDWFAVEARHARDEEYEDLCQRLLRIKLDQMELFPKIYDAIKYATIMGHAWGKVTWEEKYMTRKVLQPVMGVDPATNEMVEGVEQTTINERTFNGPSFSWCILDKIWPDPSGRERWYIEQIDTTLEEILEDQKYRNIYDPEAIARLKDSLASGASTNMPNYDELGAARQGSAYGHALAFEREPQITEGIPWSTVAPQNDGRGVILKQCWGWVPEAQRTNDRGEFDANAPEWRLVVIANGQFVLRDIPAPTPDGKPPYFPIRSIRIPGILFGESILYYIGPMADQQTRLANMRLDEVFLGIWQSMLIKQGSLASDNQMYFKPGGYMEVKTEAGQSIQDVISIMPRAPLLDQVWAEDTYRQTQAENVAAASDIQQGVSNPGSRQTATEVERKLQQGNARHILQTMLFGHDVQKQLLMRTWEWLRMRMTDPEKVRLGQEFAVLDLRSIQTPVDITIAGGFFALSKQQRAQRSQMIVAMLQNPLFAQVAKPIPIFKQMLSDQGIKNVERFMLTEEELHAQQQQQQIASILGEDPGMGGGGGQGAPGGMGSPAALPNMPQQGAGAGMGGMSLEGLGANANPLG